MPPLPEVLVVDDAQRRVRLAEDVADLAVVFRTSAWKRRSDPLIMSSQISPIGPIGPISPISPISPILASG